MSPFPPVVLVYSDRHDADFVRSSSAHWPHLPVYVAHQDGTIATKRSGGFPTPLKVNRIRAQRVIWIGIPSKWAMSRVGGPDLFKSSYVGATNKFARTKNSVLIETSVRAALDAIEDAQQKAQEAAQQERVEKVEEHRRRRLGEPAPWFIPEALR